MHKLKLLIAVATLAAFASSARAETFTVTGTLEDGGTVSGSVFYGLYGYPYLFESNPNANPPFSFSVTDGAPLYGGTTFSVVNNGNGTGPIWSPNTVFDFYPYGTYGPELQLTFSGDLRTGPATLVTGLGGPSFICGTAGGYLCGPESPIDYIVSDPVTATPLPSTWIMLLAGLGGLGLMLSRSRKNSAVALSNA
jgi:PEP-CTERM motif